LDAQNVQNASVQTGEFETAARRTFYLALAFYFLIFLCAFPFFRYLLNPDQISYISIARHYAHGEWSEAVNLYWSPLLSWLLVPLLLVGVPGIAAIKLLMLPAGACALWSIWRLIQGFELSAKVTTATLFTAAFLVAAYALTSPGPDVIAMAITLIYCQIVFDSEYERSPRAGALCGLLGALGFLTKAYLFWFFLTHFAIVTGLRAMRNSGAFKRRLFEHFVTGLLIFLVASTLWLLALHNKSGRFTLGTAAAWNHRLVGPQSPGYPQYFSLIPPPSRHAVSMWEAPQVDLLPEWHPLSSFADMLYELKLIRFNLKRLSQFFLETSLFSYAALFAYLIWGMGFGGSARYWWALVFFTIVLLPAGYMLVTIEERYIWAALLLLLLAGAKVIDVSTRAAAGCARKLAIAGYVLSFVISPARQLAGMRDVDRNISIASKALQGRIPARSRLAACGHWDDSLKIAYLLDLSFYGSTGSTADQDVERSELLPNAAQHPKPELTPAQIAHSLQEDQIAYYLVWPDCRTLPPTSLLTDPLALPSVPRAKIYRVTDLPPGR
jgi:hypothetical protein